MLFADLNVEDLEWSIITNISIDWLIQDTISFMQVPPFSISLLSVQPFFQLFRCFKWVQGVRNSFDIISSSFHLFRWCQQVYSKVHVFILYWKFWYCYTWDSLTSFWFISSWWEIESTALLVLLWNLKKIDLILLQIWVFAGVSDVIYSRTTGTD